MLAECFEHLGGVAKVVLADRMGCLKAGVVANLVVPTAAYLRFASQYGFRPDFCEQTTRNRRDSWKTSSDTRSGPHGPPGAFPDLSSANAAAAAWCEEVNAKEHSEICAVPRYDSPSRRRCSRRCPRCAPHRRGRDPQGGQAQLHPLRLARYSVPMRLIGKQVEVVVTAGKLAVVHLGSRGPP